VPLRAEVDALEAELAASFTTVSAAVGTRFAQHGRRLLGQPRAGDVDRLGKPRRAAENRQGALSLAVRARHRCRF
jgi:hypothetical protein